MAISHSFKHFVTLSVLIVVALMAVNQSSLVNGQAAAANCNIACTRHFRKVCGSDGKTYANACVMKKVGCEIGRTITKVSNGPCPEGTTTLKPSAKKSTALKANASSTNSCPSVCPLNYKPVCGADGVTYSNECQMKVKGCETGVKIKKLRMGAC